ncbi:uncharacterized protein I303_105649 [Kwoniella dejecticola CBS 10117]|uniref:Uncharacterized protein n=1 Tax=Kwoniella dejecticola CBS 10117 TaxID=1296121 RepID=A0A1A6A016_9TREE|nr:uncharacterized protein I303_05671 [Kwoniella dejecticola CBS 10117]OBR83393.1 hypothetical protein I303_05671 [Kwoniella dejecticola CBS 10117]
MSTGSASDIKYFHLVPSLAVETVGFAARAVANRQVPNTTIGPYVIQTLFLIIAPAFLAASIYTMLGRVAVGVGAEDLCPVRLRWLTKIFVTNHVVSFIIQMAGGGLMASDKASTATLGSHLVLAGLIIQIVIFGSFLVVTAIFQRKAAVQLNSHSSHAQKYIWAIYLSGALILIRSIVRVAEFIEGFHGFIITHEVFLYVFDALLMAAVLVTFNFIYPSEFSKKIKSAAIANRDAEVAQGGPERKSPETAARPA